MRNSEETLKCRFGQKKIIFEGIEYYGNILLKGGSALEETPLM